MSMWILMCVALAGCGKEVAPYGPVRGTVTCAGKPVSNPVILFEATQGVLQVTADADDAGVFEVRRSKDMPGLPPGEYRVAVTPPLFYPGIGPGTPLAKPPERKDIPLPYRDVATSGIKLTVQAGVPSELRIDMRPGSE